MPTTPKQIKIRLGSNEYIMKDAEAHTQIAYVNNALSEFVENTDSTLSALSAFKTETEEFISGIQCSTEAIGYNEYELILTL